MRIRWLPILLLALIVIAPPAMADQMDSRLKGLFTRLQAAQNANEAKQLEAGIWQLWLENKDPQVARKVAAGIVAMNRGELKVALALFDEVVKQAPNYAEGWNKRASVYYIMDAYDRSLVDVARTLALEPRHFGALSGLSMIYQELGDSAKALKALEKVQALHPLMPGLNERLEALREEVEGKAI